MAVWKPNPGPQETALRVSDDVFEELYGGARGGGKTDAGIAFMSEPYRNPRYRGLVIRRNADDLTDWIDRARLMYRGLGVKVAYRPAVFTFSSGAIIRTGHLKDQEAYTKYQGHEYQRHLIEELTQIPEEGYYERLISSCRSTVPGLPARVFATCNPGGRGHGWVKKRFIDPAPPMTVFTVDGIKRVFIPAKIDDNPQLMGMDPNYVKMLDSLKRTDIQLWRAWRMGDWDVFIGQAFSEWRRDKHTIPSLPIPIDKMRKAIGYDWGYNAPGCAVFLGVAPPNSFGVRRVYQYREIYENGKTPTEWAEKLAVFCRIEKIEYILLPHDCFSKPHGGRSIADIFSEHLEPTGCKIVRANTQAKGARQGRVAMTHEFLAPAQDGLPTLQIHQKCVHTIESVPALVYDETNVEDVDTEGDDHAYDALSTLLVKMQLTMNLLSGPVKNKIVQQSTGWKLADDGGIEGVDFADQFRKVAAKKARRR